MAATVDSLRRDLADKQSTIDARRNALRQLRSSGASNADIDVAVKALDVLKVEKASIKNQLSISGDANGSDVSRNPFRKAVVNTLQRRFFYKPAFKNNGGVAGFYDFGPPGAAVESNVLDLWRQHFKMKEGMQEVQYIRELVFNPDKFTALMGVEDEKTGKFYRADHLLKDYCEEKLEDDLTMSADKEAELEHVLAVLDDLSAEQLGAKIKEYGIVAPDTKNRLSDPFPVPPGTRYMHPKASQRIFANFEDLYDYSGNKLPFAAVHVGKAFRNETKSPRRGLLGAREFTLAEIKHFVDPDDKSHPNYSEVEPLEFLMFPRDEQMSGQSAKLLRLGEAVSKGIVNNQTLAYFIGRVFLFLKRLGIDEKRLRFRQHLPYEMAPYAADCWDAEIESSYGWIECVGIGDRSAYELSALTEKSGVAQEKFTETKEVEKLVITLVKEELGLAFKGNLKMVVEEALEAMDEKEAVDMKEALETKGEVEFEVCTPEKTVAIRKNMVSISKEKKKEYQRVFTPSVIEPSFNIVRIIYCLYEHSFYTRPSKDGNEQLNVFRFSPLVAPVKCTVFPLVKNHQYEEVAKQISKSLTAAGIPNTLDVTGAKIGKKYARTDEIGVPFAVTVDSESSVTIRERDSKDRIRVELNMVSKVIKKVSKERVKWKDILQKYPAHTSLHQPEKHNC